MASHGVPRVSNPVARTQEEAEREQRRVDDYKQLETHCRRLVKEFQHDQEALDAISKLLKQNPEYYTVWNDRRLVLLSQIEQTTKNPGDGSDTTTAIAHILSNDLLFLVPLMRSYPKCYWLWNHRAWLLQQASSRLSVDTAIEFWAQELALDTKMLQQDKRNFHGWGYRRQIVTELERLRKLRGASGTEASMADAEYEYTRKMIGQDLSNFSAWHARSNLILRMLKEKRANAAERKTMLDNELDLMHEALIDPRDQSLWFYHQFLMSTFHPSTAAKSIAPDLSDADRKQYLNTEIEYVMEALDGAEDVKWIYLSLIQLVYTSNALDPKLPALASDDQVMIWMQQLKKLDPKRANRWDDWSKQLGIDL